MKYINGQDRRQTFLFPVSLESAIDSDHDVRLIDAFVDSLPLEEFGFRMDYGDNGRPAYHPGDLLKLYLYGYLNKTRSSRDLEKECARNIEVMWLMKGLKPDHNTISNFRRDNPEAIARVFRATVKVAKMFKLIGGKLLAGDSTKMRAQNSKKNNYNQAKIDRHVEYIDRKLEEYQSQLETADGDAGKSIRKEIKKQKERKKRYKELEKQLKESGQVQISTSDPDSRQLITRNNITEVGYNTQTTVDAENCLIIDYKVTNENDSKAMGDMVTRASEIVGNTEFTALYDKGYHTGSELKTAQQLGVETIVAIPDLPSSSHAPDPAFNLWNFKFDPEKNVYICPCGHTLSTNGNWYRKDHRAGSIRVQHFKTPACKNCPEINRCTKSTRGRGRVIERSEFSPYIEANRKNNNEKQKLYKRRQAIVEHPYGIIKRQWGFYFILTKYGIDRASADAGFMFTAFNLRRIINIVGPKAFRKFLKDNTVLFSQLCMLLRTLVTPRLSQLQLAENELIAIIFQYRYMPCRSF
jgi:transposase